MLSQEPCIPCRKETPPLRDAELRALLVQLPDWELVADGKAIRRRFSFKNYVQALTFINSLTPMVEEANHHPDISFGWGYAEVTFTTHSIGGLHRNDFILASKVSALA